MARAWAAAAAMALVLVWAGAAQAATIKVTTTGDPGPAGTTSLRQAISAADNGDDVSVPAGDYVLKQGAIVVPDAIEIAGAAAATTIVNGNHAGGVFQVTSDGSVAFEDLTITGGKVAPSSSQPGGAGVFDSGTGSTSSLGFGHDVLSDNEVTGSSGGSGGAIYTDTNTLSVSDSTLSGNVVNIGASPSEEGGGAIYNAFGTATISGTTLTANKVTIMAPAGGSYDGGGAVYDNGQTVTVTDSVVSSNTVFITGPGSVNGGGAIYDDADGVSVAGSSLVDNSVQDSGDLGSDGGGALYESEADTGPIMVQDSNLSDNEVKLGDNTDGNSGGGAIYNRGGTVGVTSSTIAQNTATMTGTSGGDDGGGGVYNTAASPTLINVTLSDNQAVAPGGAEGGSFFQAGNPGTITSSTVSGNASNGSGGGVFAYSRLNIKSTIVAGNTAVESPDCHGANLDSAGYNLENTSSTECGFTTVTDIVGKPANLAPLAPNGGLAPTVALLPGSSAIGHIPKAECTTQNTLLPITTDERGVARGLAGFCDIGAFQSAPAHLAVSGTANPAAIYIGADAKLTLAIANSGPAPAIASVVKVTVPTGLQVVSVMASRGECATAHAVVTCLIGLLLSNGKARFTISVRGNRAGTRVVDATASASGSDPAPPAAERVTVAVIAPELTGLVVSPDSFPRHALVGFKLSYAAAVRFTVKRAKTALGSFTRTAHAGANSFSWRGRVGGHKLAPGRYRLVATPILDGQSGSTAATGFQIAVAKLARAPFNP
jgi:uncharacterized repeat protein (TIGR01451 family)